jgi:hypothetical protein
LALIRAFFTSAGTRDTVFAAFTAKFFSQRNNALACVGRREKTSAHGARCAPSPRNLARGGTPESRISWAFPQRAKIRAHESPSEKIFVLIWHRASRRVERASAGGGTYTQN